MGLHACRYMGQHWMLLLQQLLMAVSTVAAVQVLRLVHFRLAAASFGLNMLRRKRDAVHGTTTLLLGLATLPCAAQLADEWRALLTANVLGTLAASLRPVDLRRRE